MSAYKWLPLQSKRRYMTRETKKREASGSRNRGRRNDRSAIILDLFRQFPEKSYTIRALAAASGGADRPGQQATVQIVESMLEEGFVRQSGRGKYRLSPEHLPACEGTVDMTSAGNAYITSEGFPKDVYIDRRHTGHALGGDRVKFVVTRRNRDGDPEGEIVEVTERSPRGRVGTVELTRNHAFVRTDPSRMPADIFIAEGAEGLRDGDKVVVRITDWPRGDKCPTGKVVDVLGRAGDNDTEMNAIMAEFDLPYRFEKGVEEEAEKIPDGATPEEISRRRDFRGTTTFTIDPDDAKDFDDALSVRRLGDGLWEIGVHIADVTHYVRPGTGVETEAQQRATSVYLVDRTVPMLPERLSNELCSLRPGEEKLCFSAVFEMDEDGEVRDEWLGRTVIRSDRRFTYQEAQQVIETGRGDMAEELTVLNAVAQRMRKARFAAGAMTFDREEVKFRLDEKGRPLGVYHKEMKESNHLIEEFMLLANRRVAQFMSRKGPNGKAPVMVYRCHDKPDPDKLDKFREFILKFGYTFKATKGHAVAKEMNRLMSRIKGRVDENVISTLAIRTMAKAYYSTDNIGHYGLAFADYTHFTSPIRRYPDMMVHRLLAERLAERKPADKRAVERLCEQSSDMEVRAADAERASIKYKMVEYMVPRIGEEFNGVISGVTDWGVYVELDETLIEGMVSLRDIEGDFYTFNADEYAVKGASSGRTFTLGDGVRIRVLRADLLRRQLDFEMVASIDFETKRLVPLAEGGAARRDRSARRQPDRRRARR